MTYAELGEYGKAIPKLEALAAAKPDDPDVLRLLVRSPSAQLRGRKLFVACLRVDVAALHSGVLLHGLRPFDWQSSHVRLQMRQAETQAANKDIKSAISTYRKADAASQRSSLEIQQVLPKLVDGPHTRRRECTAPSSAGRLP